MACAVTVFALLDTSAKWLAGHVGIPVIQISWVRFLGQVVLIIVIVRVLALMPLRALVATRRPLHQLVRSLLMLATTALNFLALKYLRLDQSVAITFLTPLVVAVLAGPLLGEWIGWRRLIAVLAGFLGILIVVRPGITEAHWAFLAQFGSMLSYAVFILTTRLIAADDPPLTSLLLAIISGAVLLTPFALEQWVTPPGLLAWTLLLGTGALGGFGHYMLLIATRLAPPPVFTPFLYVQIIAMTALGYIVFGDVPDFWTLVGASVVITSGVYLIHRERLRTRERGAV
jgi:drug/metabolite transporter (DMT)-like permease